jgi:hypothetical protein
MRAFIDTLMRGDLVETVNLEIMRDYKNTTYMFAARSVLGFVFPTLEWARSMKEVIEDGTVLEVGAGTGLVAKYLNAVGVSIVATDNYSWKEKEYAEWKQFFDVIKLDYREAIEKYRASYLLLCWPMYEDPLARDAAQLFTERNPDGKILYIGEIGGCTADEEFHEGLEILDELERANSVYPRWEGLWDRCYLGRWKNEMV